MSAVFVNAQINNITTSVVSNGTVANITAEVTTSSSTAETIRVYVGWKYAFGNGYINYPSYWNVTLSNTTGQITWSLGALQFNCDHLACGGTIAFYIRCESSSGVCVSPPYNLLINQRFTLPYSNYTVSERPTPQDQYAIYNGYYDGDSNSYYGEGREEYLGSPGCCVSNAISSAMESLSMRLRNRQTLFSVGWFYGATASSGGASTVYSTALDFLQNTGAMPFESINTPSHMWRYPDIYMYNDTSGYSGARTLYLNNPVTNAAQKIGSWRQITQTNVFNWQQIFDAITNRNSAVLVSIGIDEAFDSIKWDSDGYVPYSYGSWRDGHMMLVLGWTIHNGAMYFVCQNSWGTWRGDNGIFYIPFVNMRTVDFNNKQYTGIINFYEIVFDTTTSAPEKWEWATPKVKGGKLVVTAAEWNNFCNRINEFREYKGLTPYTFTPVVSGVTKISADICKHALNGIYSIPGHGTMPGVAVKGAPITAYFFNQLRDALNAIP